jgi:hypothetical protein
MIVEHAFRAHDLVPTIGFEISDQHTLLELAAEALGLGVSTRATVLAHPDLTLSVVELADAPLRGKPSSPGQSAAFGPTRSRRWCGTLRGGPMRSRDLAKAAVLWSCRGT